jgi:hypothetical protein
MKSLGSLGVNRLNLNQNVISVEVHTEAGLATSGAEQNMDFPGGKVPFTDKLNFSGGSFAPALPPMPCYQTIDSYGVSVPEADVPHNLREDLAIRMYKAMVGVQTMDTIFYESQRQVRQLLFHSWSRYGALCAH